MEFVSRIVVLCGCVGSVIVYSIDSVVRFRCGVCLVSLSAMDIAKLSEEDVAAA